MMPTTKASERAPHDGWLRRIAPFVSLGDIAHLALLSAPSGAVRFAMHRLRGTGIDLDALPKRDPEFVAAMADGLRLVGEKYFRWQVRGIENVPRSGPALLVGSHNGGLVNTDAYLTHVAVHDYLGPHRVLNALAHDWNFFDPVLRRLNCMGGVLPAGHESARRAFARGNLVLVYPGAEMDSFRPWRDRGQIELGGRTGFLRLALRERVPIIPVVSAGTHEQFVVLTRGDAIARALGLRKLLRAQVCPIAFALPWGITLGFLPYFPLPAQTTLAFGPPITWPDLAPRDAEDPAVLARCYRDVSSRMQSAMDALHRGRRPFIGAPRTEPTVSTAGREAVREALRAAQFAREAN